MKAKLGRKATRQEFDFAIVQIRKDIEKKIPKGWRRVLTGKHRKTDKVYNHLSKRWMFQPDYPIDLTKLPVNLYVMVIRRKTKTKK